MSEFSKIDIEDQAIDRLVTRLFEDLYCRIRSKGSMSDASFLDLSSELTWVVDDIAHAGSRFASLWPPIVDMLLDEKLSPSLRDTCAYALGSFERTDDLILNALGDVCRNSRGNISIVAKSSLEILLAKKSDDEMGRSQDLVEKGYERQIDEDRVYQPVLLDVRSPPVLTEQILEELESASRSWRESFAKIRLLIGENKK